MARARRRSFDLGVGLNISGLTISGGTTSQDGLINANIRAGGSITGVNIAYGSCQQHDPAQHAAADVIGIRFGRGEASLRVVA